MGPPAEPMTRPRVVAVIQARLGSSRLPRKVLEVIGDRTMLRRVVDSARASTHIDEVVLAVPTGEHELVASASELGIPCIEGSEHDVLDRFVVAADHTAADAVVRLTADCPLLDPAAIDDVARIWRENRADYCIVEGYPRGVGDAEVIGREALMRAAAESTEPQHREHVMTYHLDHPDHFDLDIRRAPPAVRRPELRVCVDVPEDLAAVRGVVERLHVEGRSVSATSIIDVLDRHPELVRLNAAVEQTSNWTTHGTEGRWFS